jgi:putative hemin transport protein
MNPNHEKTLQPNNLEKASFNSNSDVSLDQHIAEVHSQFNKRQGELENKRAREISSRLGITEAQWVAAQCGSLRSIRLSGHPIDIFKEIPRLGPVMALTRNDYCVHERHGNYLNVQSDQSVGLVLGPEIDLRLFYSNWAHVWAVKENERSSIQFFDRSGQAVHKIYCTPATHAAEYVAIIGEYAAEPLWPVPTNFPAEQGRSFLPSSAESASTTECTLFRSAWLEMTDTHDFYPLLRRFNITRLGALQAAGSDLAQRVTPEVVEEMLYSVSKSALPIMCFVGNRGLLQIHTGAIKNVKRTGPWLNVLDEKFNLHLDTTHIDSVWIVSKPTSDGWVTSMEVFAETGELIVQFFGARKPGSSELCVWRELMLGLCVEAIN